MNRNGFEMEVEDDDDGDDDENVEDENNNVVCGDDEADDGDEEEGESVDEPVSEEVALSEEVAKLEDVVESPLLASKILSTMKLFIDFKGSSACAKDRDARRSVKARVLSIIGY